MLNGMHELDAAILRYVINFGAGGLTGREISDRFSSVPAETVRYRLRRLMEEDVMTKEAPQSPERRPFRKPTVDGSGGKNGVYRLTDSVKVFPELHIANPEHTVEFAVPRAALVTTKSGFYILPY